MASLGALVVSLGLDAADFVTGLSRSEQQAKKFAGTVDRAIAGGIIKAEIAIRALGAAARTTAEVFQSLTVGAGDFQALADTTGASAESIASLALAAGTAGVEMSSLGDAMNQLTKRMVEVDDESKAAGAALKSIGIEIADFKRLDPVGQYEAVGKALAGYADGAGKTAVALALFGKAGAEQLQVFQDLEEQGGRQVILTARQIALADEYGKAQDRAKTELRLYAQAAFSEAIPAIADLTQVAVDLARELLGVDAATGKLAANNGAKAFAEGVAEAFAFAADSVDGVVRVTQVAGKAIGGYLAIVTAFAKGGIAEARAAGKAAEEDIERVLNRATFAERLARQRESGALAALGQDPQELARRGRGQQSRPQIDFRGAQTNRAGAGKDPAAEAARYLESLQRQLQGVFDLTAAEQVLADIRSGKAGKVSAAQQEVLVGIAREIDATKEAVRVAKERADAKNKEYEAAIEAARANEQADRDRLKALLANTESEVVKRQQADIEFLRQAYYEAKISVEQYGEAVSIVMGKAAEDTKKVNDLANDLGLTFSSAFEDAIVNGESFSDVLKAIDKDITRILVRRLVTEPLANGIGSAITSGQGGGGFSDVLGAFIGAFAGSGKAIGGPTRANSMYPIAENRPEVYSDGSRSWLITGARNGRVDPNPKMGGGRTINAPITINVPGTTDRRTASQIGGEVARQLAYANNRMN